MDSIKKTRSVIRTQFTKSFKVFDSLIQAPDLDLDVLESRYKLLTEYNEQLKELNSKYFDTLLEVDATEEALCDEIQTCEDYKFKYLTIESKYLKMNSKGADTSSNASKSSTGTCVPKFQRVNLPKIELFKFDAKMGNWLKFWAQFKKINEDEVLTKEDKFHYLTQSMEPGTRAYDLINSFPPTAENYDKAIESLQNRFGKADLLVEFYIRKLLQLVMSNLTWSESKFQVTKLFDELESHLRALESLKISRVACAPMLYPLVESSLPEDLLRTWQRHVTASSSNTEPKDRLTMLMDFLRSEVENEERINLAIRGFDTEKTEEIAAGKKNKKIFNEENNAVPTASALVAGKTVVCLFCTKPHESMNCEEAKKLSLQERYDKAREKQICFRCLKGRHSFRFCQYSGTCEKCKRRHVTLMCSSPNGEKSEKPVITSASNVSIHQDVFLQTLKIELENEQGKTKKVRAMVDTGSQYSYVLKDVVEEMSFTPRDTVKIQHGLFGGVTSMPEVHHKYKISAKNLFSPFTCQLDVFDKQSICVDIPTLKNNKYVKTLGNKHILLTDIDDLQPISILIGADMAASLLTGNIFRLSDQITAVETKLGWTIIGKDSVHDKTLLAISLHVSEATVSDLWRLDTLGITDPTEVVSRNTHLDNIRKHFEETTIINEEGRYEVALPWREDHPPLTSNKEIAYKRLQKVTRKLREDNLLEAYGKVFTEWEAENIIERVPQNENDSGESIYLPHRHVVKLSSLTTPIRPVFDASARTKGSPSLNQCLETGPNLIELIPTMLLRFREKKVGVISDIRKAFLQISISPKDRNMLRFLWWDDNSELLVYRHCRVVFGLTCSPFLLSACIERHLLLYTPRSDKETRVIQMLLYSFYVDNSIVSVDSEDDMKEFRSLAVDIMEKGGFELRCWEHTGQNESSEETFVLGMRWNKQRARFVWNRVQEIRTLSDPNCWIHVPGECNPADLPSRGCSIKQLMESKWWNGPTWLLGNRDAWPKVSTVPNEEEIMIKKWSI